VAKNFYENRPWCNEPRTFQDGETVLIKRGSPIWAGYVGEVCGFKVGLHHIRVSRKPDGNPSKPFACEIPGSDLETYL